MSVPFDLEPGEVYIPFDYRMRLWDIYDRSYSRRAWSVLYDAIEKLPIEYSQGGQRLTPTPEFAYQIKKYWEPFRMQCFHQRNVEGIIVGSFLRTTEGNLIPVAIMPHSYDLVVRFNPLGECLGFRLVRRIEDMMFASRDNSIFSKKHYDFQPLDAIRIDAGATYPERFDDQDPTIFVLNLFNSAPKLNGRLSSIVDSYYDDVMDYALNKELYFQGISDARNVRLYAEAGAVNETSIKEDMINRFADAGSVHMQQKALDEMMQRQNQINASNKIKFQEQQRRMNSGGLVQTPTVGDLTDFGKKAAQYFNPAGIFGPWGTYLSYHNIVPLPPGFTLQEVKSQVVDINLKEEREELRKLIMEMFGVPNSVYDQTARMVGNVELFQDRISDSILKTITDLNKVLTRVYQDLFGEMHRRSTTLGLYLKWLRPEMQKAVNQYMLEMMEEFGEEDTAALPIEVRGHSAKLDLGTHYFVPSEDPSKPPKIQMKRPKDLENPMVRDSRKNPHVGDPRFSTPFGQNRIDLHSGAHFYNVSAFVDDPFRDLDRDLRDMKLHVKGPKQSQNVYHFNRRLARSVYQQLPRNFRRATELGKKGNVLYTGLVPYYPTNGGGKRKRQDEDDTSKKQSKSKKAGSVGGGRSDEDEDEYPEEDMYDEDPVIEISPEVVAFSTDEMLRNFLDHAIRTEVQNFSETTRANPKYRKWLDNNLSAIKSAGNQQNEIQVTTHMQAKGKETTEENFNDFMLFGISGRQFVEIVRAQHGARDEVLDEEEMSHAVSQLNKMRKQYFQAFVDKALGSGPVETIREDMERGIDVEKEKLKLKGVKDDVKREQARKKEVEKSSTSTSKPKKKKPA